MLQLLHVLHRLHRFNATRYYRLNLRTRPGQSGASWKPMVMSGVAALCHRHACSGCCLGSSPPPILRLLILTNLQLFITYMYTLYDAFQSHILRTSSIPWPTSHADRHLPGSKFSTGFSGVTGWSLPSHMTHTSSCHSRTYPETY